MRTTFSATFHIAHHEDLRVELTGPEAAGVRDQIAAIPGVARAEGFVTAPAQLAAGGRTTEVLVQGLPDAAHLVRSVDADGTPVPPGAGEIVIPRAIAHHLGVARGDRVELRVPLATGIATARLRVGGFADAVVGPVTSVRRSELAAVLGTGDAITSVAIAVAPGRTHEVRRALDARQDIARAQDVAGVRARMTELMGLGWVMLGAMLLFGSILAAAILFSTAVLGVLEHQRDLATLRALGRTMREIAAGLTLEHALLAIAGIALGIPVARITTRALLRMFSSDLFSLPFVISPVTLVCAAAGVMGVLLVAQWPALRTVSRMSLADAVRSREG
jgi:putative ABC transport system permease protein